jgi:hypothetical protein
VGRARRRGAQRPTSPAPAPAPRFRPDRALWAATAVVLLLLAAVADDRHVGLIADGRQMIRTAVALVEQGGIGQARGRDFTWERETDAVSRFGMATSLLQVPAAWLAPGIERRHGPGASQALFLVLPWLAVGIAAAAAGALARRLGADDARVVAAVLLASVAGPLGSYAHLEFSEPVQAASLALALLSSFTAAASPRPRPTLELAAGFAAGFAVLAKSSLLAAAPWTLLPLLAGGRARARRAVLFAAAGAALPLLAWAAFEFARFGRLFGGYPDDRFTHPWFDGLWRLLVGPNRGLLWFWPALPLFAWFGLRAWREHSRDAAALAWLGATLALGAQVAAAAGYWGWHGMEGWGPRLIIAALPLLAPFAVLVPSRAALSSVVGLGLLSNLPPLVQHPTPVATYVTNLPWPEVAADEVARYPFYATGRSPAGQPTVVPFEALEEEAAATPWRTYLWLAAAARLDDAALAARLSSPPWAAARPDLVPASPWTPQAARAVAPAPRLGYLGRSLAGDGGPYASVYLDALLDQAVLAHQRGQVLLGLELAMRRLALRADGEAGAWALESLRRAGRPQDAEPLLRSLHQEARGHPFVNAALALFDRDGGEEQRAHALLRSVAGAFPDTAVADAIAQPTSAWPATLDELTRVRRRDAQVARPE